jgi:hypothetical protein
MNKDIEIKDYFNIRHQYGYDLDLKSDRSILYINTFSEAPQMIQIELYHIGPTKEVAEIKIILV